jgi:hypothetical protein
MHAVHRPGDEPERQVEAIGGLAAPGSPIPLGETHGGEARRGQCNLKVRIFPAQQHEMAFCWEIRPNALIPSKLLRSKCCSLRPEVIEARRPMTKADFVKCVARAADLTNDQATRAVHVQQSVA